MLHLPPELVGTDLMVRASSADTEGGDVVTRVAKAWQLRHVADSLIVFQSVAMLDGTRQYQRRTSLPIRGVTRTQAILVEAPALYTALGVSPRRRSLDGASLPMTSLDMLRLPSNPIIPRIYDPRVRFMNTGTYIYRWRLEKQHPTDSISPVVQPIVFRITKSVPTSWRPYVAQSIVKWNAVFAMAGFRDAIVVRLPTDTVVTPRDIPIAWNTSESGQTGGGTTPEADPRTGELLGASITINAKILDRESRNVLLRGELDPRTPLPLPDSVRALLMDDIILHEVGHALGLDHNFKGSGVYPTDSLRRVSFVRRLGASTSVMAYSAGNYVAQPEDGLSFLDRRTRIGPYDYWALAWGYRPIAGATTPDDERPTLELWRMVQDTARYLQSSMNHRGVVDPTDQPFTGGNDPVKSVEYGVRNLVHLTAALDPHRDTTTASARHPSPSSIANSWRIRMTIAASVVGGVTPQFPYPADISHVQLVPIDLLRQRQAMQFVLAHVFYGKDDLIHTYVLRGSLSLHPAPSVVLFDVVALGWSADPWQRAQVEFAKQFVQLLADPAQHMSGGTHAALCTEMEGLRDRIATVRATTATARQANALFNVIDPLFQSGACAERSGK